MTKCSFCNSYREIVYSDYAPKYDNSNAIYVNICWSCAITFNIGLDEVRIKISNLFPKMLICSGCQEKFIPNKSTQTICYECYSKTKPVKMEVKSWRFE